MYRLHLFPVSYTHLDVYKRQAESFVKYSYLVRDVNEIPRIMKEAFYVANTGRKGPVLIDIPIDVQNAQLSRFRYPEEVNMRTYKPTVKGNAVQIKKVIKELEKSKKPLIYAGGGVTLSGACDELRTFAEEFRIPVVSTMMGIGVMPTEHPMYFGMVGNTGKPYANRAMNESDLLIMVCLLYTSVEGFAKKTGNPRFAYDSYRRFIQMFSDVVMEVPKSLFERVLDEIKEAKGAHFDLSLIHIS